MKTKSAALFIIALTLTGCVSQEELARRQAAFNEMQSRLSASQNNTIVTCPNKQVCDKAFSLAKIYVQNNADMKIQFSDETTISTYNPINYGYMGLNATRTPEVGDSSSIKLVASCKGMYDGGGYFYEMCANRVTPVYEGFKPFIESKIK